MPPTGFLFPGAPVFTNWKYILPTGVGVTKDAVTDFSIEEIYDFVKTCVWITLMFAPVQHERDID